MAFAWKLLLPLLMLMALPVGLSAEIVSYAIVQEDGTFVTGGGHHIRLYGIYIPPTDRTCRTFIRPIRCGPRAVLMLDFKINGHFVSCEKIAENEDGTIDAVCRVKDEDLAAWMLEHGWAVARPEAPFEYKVLEKIARERDRGVWGQIVDE